MAPGNVHRGAGWTSGWAAICMAWSQGLWGATTTKLLKHSEGFNSPSRMRKVISCTLTRNQRVMCWNPLQMWKLRLEDSESIAEITWKLALLVRLSKPSVWRLSSLVMHESYHTRLYAFYTQKTLPTYRSWANCGDVTLELFEKKWSNEGQKENSMQREYTPLDMCPYHYGTVSWILLIEWLNLNWNGEQYLSKSLIVEFYIL